MESPTTVSFHLVCHMQSAAIICANRGKQELVAESSPTVSLHLMMPYMQSVSLVTVPVNGMSSERLAESRLTVSPRQKIRTFIIHAKIANAKNAAMLWVVFALQSDCK